MFTGIVEGIGRVVSKLSEGDVVRFEISPPFPVSEVSEGDSVAVNGVCLTVTHLDLSGRSFFVDVVRETLSRTNLGGLSIGSRVNLERALKPSSRMGGHFVLGHIDGVGRVLRWQRQGNDIRLFVRPPESVVLYIVEKGFIAIDGVSLTVVDVAESYFSVALIPYTLKSTVVSDRLPGDEVNIEADIIGKYVVNTVKNTRQSGITEVFLRERGFI
ncbi:MAG: riboflavin synthase [Synergistetes bacterium]|nr:riboflavin synthase [Synergistota bacterium]